MEPNLADLCSHLLERFLNSVKAGRELAPATAVTETGKHSLIENRKMTRPKCWDNVQSAISPENEYHEIQAQSPPTLRRVTR